MTGHSADLHNGRRLKTAHGAGMTQQNGHTDCKHSQASQQTWIRVLSKARLDTRLESICNAMDWTRLISCFGQFQNSALDTASEAAVERHALHLVHITTLETCLQMLRAG